MILLDLSQVVISQAQGNFSRLRPSEFTEEFVRYMIFDAIREQNARHRAQYGDLVICVDSKSYWRKEKFPLYKYKRKATKARSKFPWDEFYVWFDKIKVEIREHLPYKYVEVDGAEADDVIGVLAPLYSAHEKVLVVSEDGDFAQLQQYKNVYQYAPKKGIMLTCDNPHEYMYRHVIKGDPGDGIPNIFSPNDIFTTEKRQKSIFEVKLSEWIKMSRDDYLQTLDDDARLRFEENENLILFSKIPKELAMEIIKNYNAAVPAPRASLPSWFMMNGLDGLFDHVGDF